MTVVLLNEEIEVIERIKIINPTIRKVLLLRFLVAPEVIKLVIGWGMMIVIKATKWEYELVLRILIFLDIFRLFKIPRLSENSFSIVFFGDIEFS